MTTTSDTTAVPTNKPKNESTNKPAIVLVHGAWGGAWIWRRVLAPLRAAGHEVHAVTLTGDGERAHLRHAGIGVHDHVNDVLALVRAEELTDIVLVGHSYAGMVITGAADVLLAQANVASPLGLIPAGDGRLRPALGRSEGRARLHALVYVDAMVPLPGEAWGSRHSSEVRAQRRALAEANDNALPPGDPAGFGLDGADRDWLLRRQVAHPFGGYGEPLHFDETRLAGLPRFFIDCNQPAYPTIEPSRQRVRSTAGWQVVEMATGHCPMVSAPGALVPILLRAAAPG